MVTLTDGMWTSFSARAQKEADREIATAFREDNGPEVEHLTDDELLIAIADARETAVNLGIAEPHLRMRFVMLDVFRLPGFHRDPLIWQMLTAPTGTADTRFGDVCGLFKVGAGRAGKQNQAWWP
ncbi:MAG: hypothetical protein ACK5JR_02020 [Tropicimonas sp.]|uniref:hypothetical protein n=1 Tax=Tropicimonas sp. TaxID=2067044 RepID=UPI003A88298F